MRQAVYWQGRTPHTLSNSVDEVMTCLSQSRCRSDDVLRVVVESFDVTYLVIERHSIDRYPNNVEPNYLSRLWSQANILFLSTPFSSKCNIGI